MPFQRKNVLINVGLAALSICIFLLILEFGVRITGLATTQRKSPPIYQKNNDERISYELRPNINEHVFRSTVATNSLGFRSEEIDHDKKLMAILGDSITFGYGLESGETLPARLSEHFPEYFILNAAVPGYHLGQELATYETKLMDLNPDALVLVFYFNDFGAITPWIDETGTLRNPGWTPDDEPQCNPIENGIMRFVPFQCWLEHRSAFFIGFKKYINRRSSQEDLVKQREEARQNPQAEAVDEEALGEYAMQLKKLRALLPSSMPKIFVIWPDKELHTLTRPRVRTLAESQGFTVIDLYDTFGNEAKTLNWDTVHPHPDTVMQAANVIADAIAPLLE